MNSSYSLSSPAKSSKSTTTTSALITSCCSSAPRQSMESRGSVLDMCLVELEQAFSGGGPIEELHLSNCVKIDKIFKVKHGLACGSKAAGR